MRTRRSFLGVSAAAVAFAALVAAAAPAGAETEIVSQEGAVPAGEGRPHPGMRREALADAIVRAVDSVARRLVQADGAQPPSEADLDQWLGKDRRAYTSGFRVVQDLGERAPQLLADTTQGPEYAVMAEVTVDVAGVRQRLEDAGVVRPQEVAHRPTGRLLLVLEPLDSHAAYAFVRQTLGAVPVEFTRGRAVLGLETDLTPDAVVQELRQKAPDDIQVGRADWDGTTLHLEVHALAPPAGATEAPQGPARLTP